MFALLNTKTEYNFLDSVVRLDDYIDLAQRYGFHCIGICDQGNLHAAYQFIKKTQQKGMQAVVSIELAFELFGFPMTIAFVAKNTVGYKNLLRISTLHNQEQRRFSDIQSHLEGLALVVPEAYSDLSALTELSQQYEIYVGITQQTRPETVFQLPTLPFPSVRYLSRADNATLEVLHTVRDGATFDDTKNLGTQELLQTADTYEKYYQKHFPRALANLSALTKSIAYSLDEQLELPRFDKSKNPAEQLKMLAMQGLVDKHLQTDAYVNRLNEELSVIHQMGFDDYFLIVGDLLRYARENQIYCGMGRGSAAGSLVAYVLQITQVDPVKNHLFFERFLNPERVAMPDIDIDMPDDRRGQLLAYMKQRYGSVHVAQIVTFSTFGKRQALRDAGKAFGMTEMELGQLTKMLSRRYDSLSAEYENNPKFKAELLKNPKLHKIYELARRIEGMPRQTSTHASGVVLSDESLVNYVPLKPSDDLSLTQYEAPDVEALGLLKIDFLGLRNLTLISQMRQLVQEQEKIDVDPLQINLEDEATLALFRAGNTMGIFQFENPQMRRFLRNLAPTKFDDIVDATSIFRPGPSQFIPEFVARRHGKEAVPLIDPSIDEILGTTYGIMIYQEQIMQVAQRFAGFSLGKADLLRRAISKKKGNEFEKLREEFLAGAIKEGHTAQQSKSIYELIERFANYGFNRSHAYAYAALAFQIAYFKVHHQAAFYEIQFQDRKRELMIADAIENGLQIESPSINQMPYHDRVRAGKIYLGLSHIQNIPRDFAFWIVENRPFESVEDFIRKCPEKFQKVELIEHLIKIGVFDKMENNRGKLLANVANLIDYIQNIQLDLFINSPLKFSFQAADDLSQAQKYEQEKTALGVGITPHPLQSLAQHYAGQFSPFADLKKNQRATVLGEIQYIRTHRAKNGQNMAFLTISDSQNQLDITLFPEFYRAFQNQLEQGKFYFFTGKVTERNDNLQLAADKIAPAELTDRKLWLNLTDASKNTRLNQILREFPGNHQVILHFADKKTTTQTNIYVEESDQLIKRLTGYAQNIIFK
ncbi:MULTISPECIES: DNA polymerase III subunit alpha [unclassified Lactococcus]|uniref:DNA polymerase III subunit alpha n=1 Tax=unclassified Lactococcus TaxID=2643510 RepID=UPI0011C81B18|nr:MULTISPECIES: DNA polymerase III subunit alpha [unclassified Lactococcus]MQW22074.1 DNA polymerase III subunit alpha [Lactococcus sp. dk101]TXK45016.1 DNA polymerase III subunit alpha [Lactococcus sp. dk310]TXK51203.1 DNA polymerase III subunit alpha [Lactococcus sp. dk322]